VKRSRGILLLFGLAGCAGPQSVLDPAGDQASALHGLMRVMVGVCGIAYLLVMAFLAVAIWRGRRRLAASAAPAPTSSDGRLRLGLMAWVAFIIVGLGVMTGASFLVDRSLAKGGDGAPEILITGQQWWWRVQYWEPSSHRWIEAANELHLPINQPTRVEVVSADVIHSFWIPSLSGKLDMIPGRVNRLTLTPRRLGWLRGQCAEFCGLQHTEMALDVKVESPADYIAWRTTQAEPASQPADDVTRHGRDVFVSGPCAVCHAVRGVTEKGRAAPDLTHVGSRRYLAAGTLPMSHAAMMGWIAQPQDHKPGAEMPATGLPPQDVDAVARYLEGLK
jgi:cytochrome c oxidase subunit 2